MGSRLFWKTSRLPYCPIPLQWPHPDHHLQFYPRKRIEPILASLQDQLGRGFPRGNHLFCLREMLLSSRIIIGLEIIYPNQSSRSLSKGIRPFCVAGVAVHMRVCYVLALSWFISIPMRAIYLSFLMDDNIIINTISSFLLIDLFPLLPLSLVPYVAGCPSPCGYFY